MNQIPKEQIHLTERSTLNPKRSTKRVLHVITRMIIGGAEWNTFYSLKLHNRSKYEPILACGPETGPEGSLIEATEQIGVPVYIASDLIREIDFKRDIKALVQLVRLYKELQVDIVHTHTSKAGILGRLAGRLARVPVVIHTVHGFAFNAPIPKWQRKLYIALEKMAGHWCDGLIFISKQLMTEAGRLGIGDPRTYALIPSGIDISAFRNGANNGNREAKLKLLGLTNHVPIIGTVSRLVRDKGLELLIEAAAKLKAKGFDFHMVWVGDGPLRNELEALAKRLRVAERLSITGMCTDVPSWVSCFDLFVLPTLWEGMGRVFLEAQAAGVPVIGTKVGGVPDVVKDKITGILVPPNDLDALVKAIETLLTNHELRRQMGYAAFQFASNEEFQVEFMVRKIEEVYNQAWKRRVESRQ
ncbi:MAG: glycosyltransferase family 4 protein [Armatimonadetes bacterium]|nr:glycosyltransferase family 4 protein [Armatimonadota bacterium]MDW8029470.1 glycosyltransferase family 4 protein [Armatimonadota bacterium]